MENNTFLANRHRWRGMSLIEVLVGLAIGMIGVLIMFQVFSATTQSGRTSGSANESQIAGTLAWYALERDLKLAGLGFGRMPLSGVPGGVEGCSVAAYNSNLPGAGSTFALTLAPVEIIPSSTGPDEIRVLYGNSAYHISKVRYNASTSTSKTLVSRDGFNLGDVLLVTDMGTTAATGRCAIVEVTANNAADGRTVGHVQGAGYTSAATGQVAAATLNASVVNLANDGYVYNLGPQPSRTTWRVTPANASNPNMLAWSNALGVGTEFQVAEGIVDLKAQYGVDSLLADGATAGHDGLIGAAEWSSATPTDWRYLMAVRFGLLVRSPNYEKDVVTTVAPTWAEGSASFVMRHVDGSSGATSPGGVNDWRHYRYRVYEAIVPLRNLIWTN